MGLLIVLPKLGLSHSNEAVWSDMFWGWLSELVLMMVLLYYICLIVS